MATCILLLVDCGKVNNCTAATSMIDKMPASVKTLLADKGYDTDEILGKLKKIKPRRAYRRMIAGRSRCRTTSKNTRELGSMDIKSKAVFLYWQGKYVMICKHFLRIEQNHGFWARYFPTVHRNLMSKDP